MKRKHRSYHRPSLLLYDDNAPYRTPSPSSPPAPSSGRFPSLPPVSSSATPTTSRYTLHQPPPPPPPPPPFMRPDTPLNSANALAILILLSFLFFMSLFSVYIRHFLAMNGSTSTGMDVSRGRRRHHAPETSLAPGHWPCSATVNGVDPAIIRSLPSYAYDGCTNYQICCPVCLSEFEEGETVKVIPRCDHVFHPQCIGRWLQCHLSCPVCRATQLLEVRSRAAEPTVCGHRRSTSADGQGTPISPVRRGDTFVHSEESEAAPRVAARRHSFSQSGRELSGDGRSSLYKTLSF